MGWRKDKHAYWLTEILSCCRHPQSYLLFLGTLEGCVSIFSPSCWLNDTNMTLLSKDDWNNRKRAVCLRKVS